MPHFKPRTKNGNSSSQGKERERPSVMVIGGEIVKVYRKDMPQPRVTESLGKPLRDFGDRKPAPEQPRKAVQAETRSIGESMMDFFAGKGCPIQTLEERESVVRQAATEKSAVEVRGEAEVKRILEEFVGIWDLSAQMRKATGINEGRFKELRGSAKVALIVKDMSLAEEGEIVLIERIIAAYKKEQSEFEQQRISELSEGMENLDALEIAKRFVKIADRIKSIEVSEAEELCARCGITRKQGDNRPILGYVFGVLVKQSNELVKSERGEFYEPGMEDEFLSESQWWQVERLVAKLEGLPEAGFGERSRGMPRETGFRQTCSKFLEIPDEWGRDWIRGRYDYSDWVSAKEYANEIVRKEGRRVPDYYVGLIRNAVDAHPRREESRFGSREGSRGRDQRNRDGDSSDSGTWFGRGNDFEF